MASLVGERRATQPLNSQNVEISVSSQLRRQRSFPRVERSYNEVAPNYSMVLPSPSLQTPKVRYSLDDARGGDSQDALCQGNAGEETEKDSGWC